MFDSIRYEFKGDENCVGISCSSCPFDGKTCNTGAPNFHAYEAIEIVEKWAKEHPIVTNAMRFKEVFGIEPSKQTCVNGIDCEDCEFYIPDDIECGVKAKFWDAEYNGGEEE